MALPETTALILRAVDYPVLVEAVYRAIKPIAYRANADNIISGLAREANEQDPASAAALGVLRGIETAEGRPLRDLDETQASQYIHELSNIVSHRIKASPDYDENKAMQSYETFVRSVENEPL